MNYLIEYLGGSQGLISCVVGAFIIIAGCFLPKKNKKEKGSITKSRNEEK